MNNSSRQDSFEEYKKKYNEAVGQSNSDSEEESFEEYKKKYNQAAESANQKRKQEEIASVDTGYINSFIDSSNRFFATVGEDYEGIGWDNASSIYNKHQATLDYLYRQRDIIESWMGENRDALDDETYASLVSIFDNFRQGSSSVDQALTEARDYYDKNANEDEYLAYVDYQNKMGYDITAGQKKIDDMERAMALQKELEDDQYLLENWPGAHDWMTPSKEMLDAQAVVVRRMERNRLELSRIKDQYGLDGDLGKLTAEERTMLRESQWAQTEAELSAVVNSPDFEEYSQKGAEIKKKGGYKRASKDMTEQEQAIADYYIGKGDEQSFSAYMDSIENRVTYKRGERWAGGMEGNTLLELAFAPVVGVDQFATGVEGLWKAAFSDDDYVAPSAVQYAGQAVREDLEDDGFKVFGSSVGQIGYDTLTTTFNMAPSILASIAVGAFSKTAGVVTGRALMGASAAGNAYIEKLNAGYTKEQAVTYGTMVGASEVLLETALSGIGALGKGVVPTKILSALDDVDNVLAKVAKSVPGQMALSGLSEATEEGLQSILEPVIWSAVSGEDITIEKQEVLYSALLGFISGGMFEAGETAIDNLALNRSFKKGYAGKESGLVTEALEADPESKFAQKMQGKLDKGKNLSGSQIRKLYEQTESALVSKDMASIQEAVEATLVEYGETGDVKAISEALAKKVAGKSLTKEERATIYKSDYGRRVENELNPENIRRGGYTTAWAESIGTKRINPAEYSRLVQEAEAEVDTFDPTVPDSTSAANSVPSDVDATTGEISGAGSDFFDSLPDVPTDEDVSVSLEEASQKYGAQAKAMVATYNKDQNVRIFDSAYSVAYEMGKTSNVLLEDALNSEATQYLTPEQREHAFNAGRSAAVARDKTGDQRAKASGKNVRREGRVSADDGLKMADLRKTFNDPQNKAYNTLVTIARVTGINIVLTKSKVDAQGRYVGDNGKYVWKDDTIYIDINAGLDYAKDAGEVTKYSMLRTFSHEFTHFLEKNAPIEYSALRDLVFAEMKARGENVDNFIRDKQTKYDNISYEAASREVVADSMTDMLRDASFIEKLTQKHQTLAQKLLTKLKEFLANIKSYFAQLADNPSLEAKAIQQEVNGAMKYLESVIEAFDTAAMAAVENYQGIVTELTPGQEGVVVAKDGEPVAYSTEDGTVMLSIRTYEDEGRSAFRTYLEKCVKNKSLTATEMQEMMDGIEEIYTVCKAFKDKYAPFSKWSEAEVIRDTHGKPVFSVVTPNGEYKMNLDFSLVCKKRRTLDAVFNEMSKRGIIDDFELGPKTIVKINELIRKHGFETACALCFVDAKRFRQADVADSVVRLYNELVQSLVPEEYRRSIDYFNFAGYRNITPTENGIHTWPNSKLDFSHINEVLKQYPKNSVEAKAARYIKNHPDARRFLLRGDFMSSAGFDAVKSQNQNIMKIYNSKKGTGGPKAAFGDVQYMNEIISKKTWTPEKAYDVGGVRIQSFSDYVPRMVFDYVQMIYDLAAKKLPAHAYTKEALFVMQFGLTGIKINMSLIPAIVDGGIAPGLDANGDYVWAGESFDFETAKAIQAADGYSENCGTIAVGVSYEHIMKLLGDPNIRMVIPYHKSSLNPVVAHMNRIGKYTDYTKAGKTPVEHGGQRTTDKDGKTIEHEFNFAKTLHEVGDPKAVADQYLAWCDKKGYTPKFDEFRGHENYYKLLTDFTVYDASGNYVAQREVKAVFPKDGGTFGSMKDLIQAGLEEDAIIEGRRESKMSEMVDDIVETIARTEAEIPDDEQVEQADHDLEAEFMDANRVQKQARSYIDNPGDDRVKYRKNSKRSKSSETETAFLSWSHGSAPEGDVKKFVRFGKTHYYEKTAEGCVELSKAQYNERSGYDATKSLRTAKREISENAHSHESSGRNVLGDSDGHRDPGRASAVSGQAIGEELRDEAGGSVSSDAGYSGGDDSERVQYQLRSNSEEYAPTFYSQMAKVVSGMKQDKFGASSVVDMLRGRGVKAEEIKWSGIEAWLEGKKSVTKAELQEFIAGSMLQIEDEVLADKEIPYSQDQLDQIAQYEEERDIIVENLKSEWKRIVGTDIPITYFGSGLESAVVNNLMLANKEKTDHTEAGYQYNAKRAALERVIEDSEDYFGFDTARHAFRAAVKDPKGFIKAYEMTAFEESVFKDFIKAKEAYEKLEGISIKDIKALKAIAESADRFSARIVNVQSKHRSEAAKHLSKYRFYTIKGGRNYRELLFRIPESTYSNGAMYGHWERSGVLAHARVQDIDTFIGQMLFIEEIQSDWHNEGRKTGYENVPDAPFRDNYHEFVLKKLIRMAAEQGYASIGWTTADIQSERWSDEFAEGYRIEYDQEIPKFLRKYGKKWGATVGKTVLDSGVEVWSMVLTDSMVESVLYEGQAQYQKRTNTLTDHEILDMAATELDTSKLTDGERTALAIFRKKNDALKALKAERQKQGSLYYEAQFGTNKDREQAAAARNRMAVLDSQIQKASAEVLGIEDKKILRDVLQKSRKVIEQHERKASIERVRVAREEARAKERRIADERLEAMRQKKNERIAEVRAEERQKAQEKLDALRQKKNERIEEVRAEEREKAQQKAENRKKTEIRGKIKKQLSELNSLLQHGNKKKNVKNGMKDTAASLLAYGELLFSEDANLSPEAMVRNGIETDLTEAESKLLNEFNDLMAKRDQYLAQISEAASGTDANKDARIEGLQEMVDLINKKKLPELAMRLEGVFERERARLNKVTFSAVLKDLTDSYKALEQSKDPYISGAYSAYVYDRLVAMNNPNAGVTTTIKDMSLAQLAELNDAIKMVVTSIKNANTLFREGQREVLSERAEKVFMEIRKLYRKGGDPTAARAAVTDAIKSFAWNDLKPVYAFERIGSEQFTELFWDVINGESEYGLECDKAADFVRELRESCGYKKWDFDSVKVFKTADGQDFKLTLGDMMSIFAYSRRDQAQKHMFEGGFTFHTGKTETYRDTDGKKRVRLVSEDTYRMTPELLDKILSSLSKEQKAYAEAMQDYLTKLGEMGNKVSQILYGIDLFKETHYFPLRSDRDYRSTVETQLNQTQTAASLVNIGMAKETVPEASNPIVLQRFDDVAVQHIDQMLKYSSMVLPIENLRKVLDFAPGEYGTWNAPVKKLISTVHGTAASQYVNQWLTDLNGSSGTDGARHPFASMFARSKKVAVAGNLSVVAQQYFAVARAMSEIDGKYFVSSKGKADGSQWEELKKWAGVAVIKDIGGFDMGSARSATEYIGKVGTKVSAMDVIDKTASYGSAKMDELGWGTIWRAAKAEIADTTNLKVGSDEFFKAAAKRFTEVVVKTQVYDSVTARSGFMRSKNEAVKYLVSFMGEPTTTVNMMLNAQMKLIRAKRSGNKADIKKARAYMARTSGAVILSTVLSVIAKSAVYAMRDDEETESFLERYVKQIGSSFHQELNPLNLLPVARDIMSMVQGRDIERPDMALINSTIKAFKNALKADENQVEAWIDVGLAVGNLLGLPLKNVLRDGAGVARLIGDITDDIGPADLGKTFFQEGFLGREATKNENLYAAIISEDTGRLEVLKKGYKSDADYTNAIRKALRECDDRIQAAAKARYEGDTMTYIELAKEIISEGHFVQDDVVAAIMSEVTAMENEAAGEKVSNPKIYSMYTAADYLSVVDQPETSGEIKDYLIGQYIEKGKTEEEAESEFKSDLKDQIKTWYTDEESKVRITKQEAEEMLRKHVGMSAKDVTATINKWSCKVVTGIAYEDIKDEFLTGNVTASRAIDMRVRYGGMSKADATAEVSAWNAEKKYGLAPDLAKAYTKPIKAIGKSLEQAGIKADVFTKYKDLSSKCEGYDEDGDGKTDSGSVKEQIMDVIHSLPLTVPKKDALYYSNSTWSVEAIDEAPWHKGH